MKKSLFVAAIATLALVACKKTETTDAAAAADSTAVEAPAADSAAAPAADSTAAAAPAADSAAAPAAPAADAAAPAADAAAPAATK